MVLVVLATKEKMRSKSLTRTPLPAQTFPDSATPPKENMRSESLTRTPLPAQPFHDLPIPVQHAPSEQQYEEPISVQGTYPPSSPPATAASSPEPYRLPAPSSPVPAQRPRRIRKPNSMPSSDTWDLSSLVENSPTLSSKQVTELLRSLASKVEYADISLRHHESQTFPEGGR